MVILLVGLSGAGKTTVGRIVYEQMKARWPNTAFVDGDEIRAIFQHDQGEEPYTVQGRQKNAHRIRELCAFLDRQDIHVVCCMLSIFEETHRWCRENFEDYLEVYLEAPLADLQARDAKGLYAKAARGETPNVVGLDIPFTPPENPDLVLRNGLGAPSPEEQARKILQRVHER